MNSVAKQFVKEYKSHITLAVVAEFLLFWVLYVLHQKNELETPWYIDLLVSLSIPTILVIIYSLLATIIKSKEELYLQMKVEFLKHNELLEDYNNRINHIQSGHKIIENYYDIASEKHSNEINEYILELERENKLSLIQSLERIGNKRLALSKDSGAWRILIERLIGSEHNDIDNNIYHLSIENYLKIIKDSIKVGINKAKSQEKKLIINCFTFAKPSDWFEEKNSVIGHSLASYGSDIKGLINQMKANEYEFRRFVLCRNSKETILPFGLDESGNVIHDFLSLNERDQKIYLNDYHTNDDHSEMVKINLENLKFENNNTEFIYFGLSNNGKIDWYWCISAGYTSDNRNVSASFWDEEAINHSDKKQHIIMNIEMKEKVEIDGIKQSILNIEYKKFPEIILDKDSKISSRRKFRNIVSFVEKWEIFSQIWHIEKEKDLYSKLFSEHLIPSTSVLDCGAGTGYHSFLLKTLGYDITAIDSNKDFIDKLKLKNEYKSNQFPCRVANWNTLTDDINDKKFDNIVCLGTALPYHRSWTENFTGDKNFNKIELINIINQFKLSLNNNGKLIIGVSRHNTKNVEGIVLRYKTQRIEQFDSIPTGNYTMEMHFKYDWNRGKKLRTWDCIIKNDSNDDYSFTLYSHLFDADDLSKYCESVFGVGNVKILDLGLNCFDLFVICTNEHK